jgi:hypothetical protein
MEEYYKGGGVLHKWMIDEELLNEKVAEYLPFIHGCVLCMYWY